MAGSVFARMAEGKAVVETAGVDPWEAPHPMAVRLMKEQQIDISSHRPRHVRSVTDRRFDIVVTIGEEARRGMPLRLKGDPFWLHWNIADPAEYKSDPSDAVFRKTLHALRDHLNDLLARVECLAPSLERDRAPGVSTLLWQDGFDPERHVPIIAQAGFEALELCLFSGWAGYDGADGDQVRVLRRVADSEGVAVWSIHAPQPTGDLGSSNSMQRKTAIDALARCLDLADALGAHVVVSHDLASPDAASGRHGYCAESLARLAPMAEKSFARIGFENMPPEYQHDSVRKVWERVRNLSPAAFGCVLDTGHAQLAGQLDDAAEWGERLISVHLHDTDGTRDSHDAPTHGAIDWSRVRALLNNTAYSGCLMYEADQLPGGVVDARTVLDATMAAHRRIFERDNSDT